MEIYKQFRALEVPRSYPDVVFCLWVVEFGQTPINEAQLGFSKISKRIPVNDRMTNFAVFVINHHVVRFDISVHDPFGMAIVKSLCKGSELSYCR